MPTDVAMTMEALCCHNIDMFREQIISSERQTFHYEKIFQSHIFQEVQHLILLAILSDTIEELQNFMIHSQIKLSI